MKLVADVSSSINRVSAPTSRASMMLAAWEVLPLASLVENCFVSWPNGKLEIKGEISTFSMFLPSSALILMVL